MCRTEAQRSAQRLTGATEGGVHITDVSNASRTLLLNLRRLQWEPSLLEFFGLKASMLPTLASSSEVYGKITYGMLKGVEIAGLAGDQQAALVGNKCLRSGEAKCTYGTGAFLLFCTGEEVVESKAGLISSVRFSRFDATHIQDIFSRLRTRMAKKASQCIVSKARVRTVLPIYPLRLTSLISRCRWKCHQVAS